MAQRQQTSVRISARAMEALQVIAGRRGLSRDEAVRQLLREYIAAQSATAQERRLTHISTVLRYPPAAPGLRNPDGRMRLAMRLEEGMAASAGALALRLPGQAAGPAYREYGARLLTDAVVTAIARVDPFVDDGLEGLPPLLTQRAALGLWRLTVAATLGCAERWVLHDPTDEAGIVLRNEGVAWHDPWRFAVALHLARRLFIGPQAGESLAMVTEQTQAFDLLRSDLELTVDHDHHLLEGLPVPDRALAGRSGSAVWRARRQLATEGISQWLTSPGSAQTFTVEPPGWELEMPSGWHGHHLKYRELPPPSLQAHLDEGRVLQVTWGSRSVLWPLDAAGTPIAGIGAVISGAGDVTAAALVEIILVDRQYYGRFPDLYVPAQDAHRLGFITKAERDRLVRAATERTTSNVEAALPKADRLDGLSRRALYDAASNPTRFAALAARSGIKCPVIEPTWVWRIGSVTAALSSGTSDNRLWWLARTTRLVLNRYMESDMEGAWHAAFRLSEPPPEEPV